MKKLTRLVNDFRDLINVNSPDTEIAYVCMNRIERGGIISFITTYMTNSEFERYKDNVRNQNL